MDFFLQHFEIRVTILCFLYFSRLYRENDIVKLIFGRNFFLGAKLSVSLCWCQVVLVPNCPFSYLGAKLSVCLFGAKLSECTILVPNSLVQNCLSAKLSSRHIFRCQIVPCQIFRCQIVLPPF